MIYIIIYLVGYFSALVYMIYDARKEKDIYIDDILIFSTLSLGSWVTFIIDFLFDNCTLDDNKIIIFKKRKEK